MNIWSFPFHFPSGKIWGSFYCATESFVWLELSRISMRSRLTPAGWNSVQSRDSLLNWVFLHLWSWVVFTMFFCGPFENHFSLSDKTVKLNDSFNAWFSVLWEGEVKPYEWSEHLDVIEAACWDSMSYCASYNIETSCYRHMVVSSIRFKAGLELWSQSQKDMMPYFIFRLTGCQMIQKWHQSQQCVEDD